MRKELYSLEELIQGESGLDDKEAIRLADAWRADVMQELQTSGISVIRGLGTFTLSEGRIHFQQDADFPSLTDLPAVEGFSAQLTAAAAPGLPDFEQPSEPEAPSPVGTEEIEDHSDFATDDTLGGDVPEVGPEVPFEDARDDIPDRAISEAAGDTGASTTDLSDIDSDSLPADNADWTVGMEHALEEADRKVGGSKQTSAASVETDASDSGIVLPDTDSPLSDAPVTDTPDADVSDSGVSFENEANEANEADREGTDTSAADEIDAASAHTSSPSHTSSPARASAPSRTATRTRNAPRSRTPKRYERTENSSSKAALWTLGIVVLVVVAALIYRFAIPSATEDPTFANQQTDQEMVAAEDSILESASTATDSTTTASAADTPSDADSGDTSASTDDSAGASIDPAEPSPSNNSNSETPPPPDEIVRGMGGYTLVVASTLNEQTARRALPTFRSLGLPLGILAYESEDPIRYRIAVGHYDSVVEADSARNRLASDLPEGTWVLPVR